MLCWETYRRKESQAVRGDTRCMSQNPWTPTLPAFFLRPCIPYKGTTAYTTTTILPIYTASITTARVLFKHSTLTAQAARVGIILEKGVLAHDMPRSRIPNWTLTTMEIYATPRAPTRWINIRTYATSWASLRVALRRAPHV